MNEEADKALKLERKKRLLAQKQRDEWREKTMKYQKDLLEAKEKVEALQRKLVELA